MPDIFSMFIFCAIITLILTRPKITIPHSKKQITIDFGIAPLLGVAILLLTFQISGTVIINGILGTTTINPSMIIVLFFSLAYVCISIDMTGFFAYLALLAAKRAGSSSKRLFFYFFALSSVLTTFTSNDIVILTLTPIILYFCKYTKVSPIPFLIGEFFAANIWSIALYIGNPTNIIVAQAYNLSFIEYSMWMLFPTIIAGISCYLLLSLTFKQQLKEQLTPPDITPSSALKNKYGAIFGLIMLASCLLLLSVAPIFNLNMGVICFVFAIIMLSKDILTDIVHYYQQNSEDRPSFVLNSTKIAFLRVPWKIMPFIFGMFVMVEVLWQSGWISLFADVLSGVENQLGLIPSVFFMCFLSALACNIINNQPMTILFTRILQDPIVIAGTSTLLIKASMFALIMGSNFGANFTLIGALAGIMWSNISEKQGVPIKYKLFAKYGFTIMPLVVAAASLVLAIEFILFPVLGL